MSTPESLFVVLQQLERSSWCVVRRRLQDGRPTFASRVARARPYEAACRAAMNAAKAESLRIGIQAIGAEMRPFDPRNDMREPRR
ncbi:hypothetical protein [Sphingomonas faeni]|uniref:hypothetical protein n=1 Tax=Sphingomonas faeni TaxID=185950 RepID=UPI002412F88C|nr:hypothetical protein [Sphingomonas faeni]